MAKGRTGLIGALDIGSSKVTCLIARASTEGSVRVVGVGHHASAGLKCGAIVDMEAAETAILTAVTAAEEMAGDRLRSVFVNLSGARLASSRHEIEVSVAGHEVGEADIRRINSHRFIDAEKDDRELIHCFPTGFSIDGNRGIRDPRGMYGDSLGAEMHLVTAASGPLKNLRTCIARCHLDIDEIVVSPYAAGLACLVEDEMDLGVTVVDMGGGTTTLSVFYDGEMIHADSIPVGGSHVTADIARGLSTSLFDAERMKTLFGNAISSPSDDRELIDVPLVGEDEGNQPNHVPRSMLVGIVRPRLEETFELVRNRLETSGIHGLAGRRLVLTGGASQLQGVRELAALILEKQVRPGRPLRINGLPEATSGPAFTACAGMLRYAADTPSTTVETAPEAAVIAHGRLGRLGQWIRENF